MTVTIDVNALGDYAARNDPGTYIGNYNTANQAGTLDIVYIRAWASTNGCKVGTCYKTRADDASYAYFRSRDYENVGALSEGLNTFTGLDIDVEVGDGLIVFYSGGATPVCMSYDGGYYSGGAGDRIDGQEYAYNKSSSSAYGLIVYATGVTANAVVTAVVALATTLVIPPTFEAQIVASITGVVATATALVIPGAFDATSTFPPVAAVTGILYPPAIRITVAILCPAMRCGGEFFKDIGHGAAVIAIPLMTCSGKGMALNAVHLLYHSIYTGQYFLHPTYVNRVYVVGRDTDSKLVFGEAFDSTHIAEYGEVLKPVMSVLITTATLANTIAADILSNTRLEADLGTIQIPPNCGMEMGDVISITDSTVNQAAKKYRVVGFGLIYNPLQPVTAFRHTIKLTEV